MFPDEPLATFLFHQIQFRLAVASNHSRTIQLAEKLMVEAEQLTTAKGQELIIAMVAGDILLALKTSIPPKLLLRCWIALVSKIPTSEIILDTARITERELPRRFGMPKQSFTELFFGFILFRRGDSELLKQFVEAVDALNSPEKEQVVGALRANQVQLRLFVDRAWIEESSKPTPEWDRLLIDLQAAWAAGKRWGVPEMTANAARAIAIVYDEYLKKSDDALAILNQAAKEIGADHILLRLQRGNVFYRKEQYQDAYGQWGSVRLEMKTDDFLSAMDALPVYPKFGEVAGYVNQWDEAATIFLNGRTIAQNNEDRIGATAFGVDGAHALWFGGKRAESLALMATCLDELEAQAGSEEPDGFHTMWKVTEQIVRWCSINAGPPGHSVELKRVGLCSESKDEDRHNLVKNRPRAPIVLIWLCLAEAELYANLGRMIYDRLTSRTDGASFVGTRVMKASFVLRRVFHDREFSGLPIVVEEIAIAGSLTRNRGDQGFFDYCPNPEIPPNIAENVKTFANESFSAALLSMAADGKEWQGVLGQWRKSARQSVTDYDFESMFGRIEFVLGLPPIQAGKIYLAAADNRLDRLLASIRLATSVDSSLSNCFVGCVSLVTDGWLSKGQNGEGNILGILTRDIWRKRLKFRSEFNSPRTSVPAIESACELPYGGVKLGAHILLAARTAVTTRVPDDTLTMLHQFAGESK